jgi:threonine dehydratase
MQVEPLALSEIRATADLLRPYVIPTPVYPWRPQSRIGALSPDTEVHFKLELLQRTGTFKLRGALSNMLRLSPQERRRGVTAVSAGNHAIAVAYVSALLGVSAKLVMPTTANPARVERVREYGGEVIQASDAAACFELAGEIVRTEERTLVHPFEGKYTALGTATLGAEFLDQAPALDALLVGVGGGGLIAGVASACKLRHPACRVYGVEPEGADTMHRSFRANAPQKIDRIATIADSLGAPMAMPYTFGLCRMNVDELVRIGDDLICGAMAYMFRELKLAVEPGGAAAFAALMGPLGRTLQGKRVGVIVCGSNIDLETFANQVGRGERFLMDLARGTPRAS